MCYKGAGVDYEIRAVLVWLKESIDHIRSGAVSMVNRCGDFVYAHIATCTLKSIALRCSREIINTYCCCVSGNPEQLHRLRESGYDTVRLIIVRKSHVDWALSTMASVFRPKFLSNFWRGRSE